MCRRSGSIPDASSSHNYTERNEVAQCNIHYSVDMDVPLHDRSIAHKKAKGTRIIKSHSFICVLFIYFSLFVVNVRCFLSFSALSVSVSAFCCCCFVFCNFRSSFFQQVHESTAWLARGRTICLSIYMFLAPSLPRSLLSVTAIDFQWEHIYNIYWLLSIRLLLAGSSYKLLAS